MNTCTTCKTPTPASYNSPTRSQFVGVCTCMADGQDEISAEVEKVEVGSLDWCSEPYAPSVLFHILELVSAQTSYIHYVLSETLPDTEYGCENSPVGVDCTQIVQPCTANAQSTTSVPRYNGDLRHFINDIPSLPLADYPPRARTLRFSLPTEVLCAAGVAQYPCITTSMGTRFDIHPSAGSPSHTDSIYVGLLRRYITADAIPSTEIIRLNLNLLSISFGAGDDSEGSGKAVADPLCKIEAWAGSDRSRSRGLEEEEMSDEESDREEGMRAGLNTRFGVFQSMLEIGASSGLCTR
ncbi:unnamed protein product [Periconia digitata]|uniref:Uncharacterized protein n=1 Tax=Periconia digitata TaxID=1303443 RepID=A0A9W4UVN6_9PLEO|nr:unnamed protein product [Periconia digitata]